jgi:hypothetical protein
MKVNFLSVVSVAKALWCAGMKFQGAAGGAVTHTLEVYCVWHFLCSESAHNALNHHRAYSMPFLQTCTTTHYSEILNYPIPLMNTMLNIYSRQHQNISLTGMPQS